LKTSSIDLTIVIPVFNETSIISEIAKRVKINSESVTPRYEIIFVDDGSYDDTWMRIAEEANVEERIKAIRFSRNFGQHFAITAGIHHASGEWVVIMDGDLQDRPEIIPELYNKAKEGFDVVFVSRVKRPESGTYLALQKFFYWILKTLSGIDFDSKQANFSIISRKVVNSYKRFPEKSRFYGSTIKWLGFKRTSIVANHGQRFSGNPSYTFRKRLSLALDIITSFSDRPLKIATSFGIIISVFSVLATFFVLYRHLKWGYSVVGWSSIMVSIFFFSGIILIVLGIMGNYIGRIFQEVKGRPLYIIQETIKFL
jgi:glycosyltransferase involved in cell wall biosynthesis